MLSAYGLRLRRANLPALYLRLTVTLGITEEA
jgi:hypothetical protein